MDQDHLQLQEYYPEGEGSMTKVVENLGKTS